MILGQSDEELILSRFQEVAEISLLMAEQATRSISIFTQHLEPTIYATEAFTAAVARMCRANTRHAKVRILLTDPDQLGGREHRLVQLAQRLSSFIHLHQPAQQHRGMHCSFLLADLAGYVYREHGDRPEARANFNHPFHAREHEQTFSAVWEQSEPLSMFRRLGI